MLYKSLSEYSHFSEYFSLKWYFTLEKSPIFRLQIGIQAILHYFSDRLITSLIFTTRRSTPCFYHPTPANSPMSLIETIKYSFFGRSSYRQIVYFQSGDATVTFYILVGDKVVSQSFPSIEKAHEYMRYYKISGQVIDEQILQELRQEAQQNTHHQSFDNSIIKRAYQPRETNMRVPVQRYETQRVPNRTVPYQSFKPHFVRRRRKK